MSKVFKNLKRSILFASKYEKKRLVILFILAAITAVLPYMQNGFFGKLIDATIAYKTNGAGIQNIFNLVLLLITLTILPNIVNLLVGFVDTTFRFNINRNLELFFLKKISTLDIATIESDAYQQLTQKANERGVFIFYTFIDSAVDNFSNLIGVIVSLFILGFIDKTLLIYAFLGSAPALYVQLRYGRDVWWIWDLNSANRRKFFNRRGHFNGITALTEMKLYQLSKRFIHEIKRILDDFDSELESLEKNKLIWEILALLAFAIFLGLGVWRIFNLALLGLMPIGLMLFAYTTYRGFKGTLNVFFRRMANITEWSNYTGYWFNIMDIKPQIENSENAHKVNFAHTPPKIEFVNVSFRYDKNSKKYSLKNLSFTIESGEKIAIVGLSGAGKTTLIKLLCRVYDPETGHILVDGKDLRQIDLDSWQEQLGVLFQDFSSYELPVKDAIAVSNPNIGMDLKKVKQAAQMAKADSFIELLPKKYDQLLWKGFEDGVDLSKGERQRVALARVFYRESPITILDEPTASVDALAEQEIFETLEGLPANRTVILISHRFSTVKNADKILVVEHGQIIEEGKHAKLMTKAGRYAELYTIQAESYK